MKTRNWKKNRKAGVSKADFCRFCNILYERHLVSGSGGNLSIRAGERIFVTPSGASLRDLTPEMVVAVNQCGEVLGGANPTKDVAMHLGILEKRPDVHVVCHVHGASIIAASGLLTPGGDVLPPLTPGFVYFAHPLAMLPFMVPGSEALAQATADKLGDLKCSALLLQNHGLVTVGGDFQEAINLAEEVEEAARIYILTNGKARKIPEEGVKEIKSMRVSRDP
ncbi:MAG: class II aldolase/adducin family protein [Deltaproteobacteria bacterium]|jgi:ribulose-5-phosphate 4-epimerase/fuculose-1-phosphate aldolase